MLLINDIKLGINVNENKLKAKIEKFLGTKINSFTIKKKSLDARKEPVYVYSVLADVDNEDKYIKNGVIKYTEENLYPDYKERNKTAIIVGYGPSGIMSAYRLCLAGYKVIVFERGKRIRERVKDVDKFFSEGILDPDSNVQFGEGGAGTFSDAKLTTRIKDRYVDFILDVFVKHGAKESIKYEHHPHIGTDNIRMVIENITDYLISSGVEFHFEEEIEGLITDDSHTAVGVYSNRTEYYGDYILFGIGHSSYNTICSLRDSGVYIESKDMAIGFRVEHFQSLIDERQTSNLIKEPNEYLLRYKGEKGVYSFCMCPGGMVIPSMSDVNTIVTNGMSYSSRDSGIANSAILIQVNKNEFEDGYVFLKNIETAAYNYSGSYKALAQNIKDFMNGELNSLIFESTYPLGTVLYDFNYFFIESDLRIVKDAIRDFDKKIPGFIEKGIMVGPETRSSSPVRITRNDRYESINTPHLYPMGEGAGYGGGIMSCCLDGIRISNIIINDDGNI